MLAGMLVSVRATDVPTARRGMPASAWGGAPSPAIGFSWHRARSGLVRFRAVVFRHSVHSRKSWYADYMRIPVGPVVRVRVHIRSVGRCRSSCAIHPSLHARYPLAPRLSRRVRTLLVRLHVYLLLRGYLFLRGDLRYGSSSRHSVASGPPRRAFAAASVAALAFAADAP